ncbi:MAG: saccharopine dehydrogenase NADP-binding domain-containing protein [Myxococcota bacterium]
MAHRPFDVIVYGATGFTGQLVAEYLARGGATERWALAGRNRAKLEALRTRLEKIDARWKGLPIVEASATDQASLNAMAAQTHVVLSTVGPFIRYGLPLVEACVEESTNYCDITGEPEFVDATLGHHETAREKGIRIVSCCGFDSVPHDLGAFLCARRLRELAGEVPMRVRGFVRSRGTFSGGTWQSAVQAFANFREHQAKRKTRTRIQATNGRSVRAVKGGIQREPALGAWAVPLPTIDGEIVRRSAKALDLYGPEFRYGHYAQVKKLPTVIVGGAAVAGIALMAQLPPTRKLLQNFKGSGEGPTESERAKSWFKATFLGEAAGQRVKTVVSGGDPGYDETAKMIAETALSLAASREDEERASGVVTPVVACGMDLVERLAAAEMGFETHDRW